MIRRRFLLVGAVLALASPTVTCGRSSPSMATPAPTPAPTPTPAPAPTPAAFVCPLPPSVNTNDCPVLNPQFSDLVNGAINQTIAQHPELFNLTDLNGANPRVLDRQKYHEAVAAAIEAQGACVLIEKEEIAVKNTNDFNEQWNIYTSVGFVRRHYVTTCIPASF